MLPVADSPPAAELPPVAATAGLPARFLAAGPAALSDGELIALALGCPAADGQRLVDRFGGGAWSLARAGLCELVGGGNLSLRRACRLKAAFELGRRAVDAPLERGAVIRGAEDVAERLRGRLAPLEHEELHALGLDTHNGLVVHLVAASGAANLVHVAPRDVFRPLIREGASGAILVHNHPSGSPEPSSSDAALTRRFLQAGAVLGLPLIDHVILARRGRYSFAEREALRNLTGG